MAFPLSGDQQFYSEKHMVGAVGSDTEIVQLRLEFKPDIIKFISMTTITSRVDIKLGGMKGGGVIPIFGQGPVDLPGLEPQQKIELTNLDTVEREILVVAQKGYQPAGINAPSNVGLIDQSNLYGWISGAWQRNPLTFGYSSQVFERISRNSPGGSVNYDTTPVPAGEIHTITLASQVEYSGGLSYLQLQLVVGGVYNSIAQDMAPANGKFLTEQGWFVLGPGDLIRGYFGNSGAGALQRVMISGFSVDIDQ